MSDHVIILPKTFNDKRMAKKLLPDSLEGKATVVVHCEGTVFASQDACSELVRRLTVDEDHPVVITGARSTVIFFFKEAASLLGTSTKMFYQNAL